MNKEERGRGKRGLVTWLRQVINQHGKIAQEGLTITLVEGRAAQRRGEQAREPAEAASEQQPANPS